jgi:2'-5' RNA ligase
MRLFYAINFSDEIKDRLTDIQSQLRKRVRTGRFSLRDNLHLTLVFIGEVPESRAQALFDITDALVFEPFELLISGLGSFRRDRGSIVWCGIEGGDRLQSLYENLAGRVRNAGFDIEARRYTPHLTLARDVKFPDGFDLSAFSEQFEPMKTRVTKASLMKSETIGGRLTYTEIR